MPEKHKGLYCFLGEASLREAAVAQTIQQIKQSVKGLLSEISLEGDAVSLERLALETRIVPLFEDGKILKIRHADELAQPDRVLALLERRIPIAVYLIFEADKLDKQNSKQLDKLELDDARATLKE